MRLIDADAIPYREIWREDWLHNAGKYQQGVFRDEIEDMPTVDAVPVRHGKWIDITESHIGTCSLCGDRWGSVDMMNYCPSCGARMDEE